MQQIVNSGNDYLIAVKGNQPKLLAALKTQFDTAMNLTQAESIERTRDREVKRCVSVFEPISGIDPEWVGLQRIVRVERSGTRSHKPFHETMFYISSLSLDAAAFARLIRQHWQVENRVHWVKDVVMKEDVTPVCDGHALINFAIIRTIALNLFRHHGFASITQGIRQVAHDIPRLFSFLQ